VVALVGAAVANRGGCFILGGFVDHFGFLFLANGFDWAFAAWAFFRAVETRPLAIGIGAKNHATALPTENGADGRRQQ
jgi:hypothetical protein